jgi:electron transfer flavoprotein alpha subunit
MKSALHSATWSKKKGCSKGGDMSEIYALVEHRHGILRDITFELLSCGRKLATARNTQLAAVLLGVNATSLVEQLKGKAHKVLVADDPVYKDFNAEVYQVTLHGLIKERSPFLTLIGHTAYGYDLCSPLATQLNLPFTTDCLDVKFTGDRLSVVRQMFDGKLNARVILREHPSYIISIRSGCFPPEESSLDTQVETLGPALRAQPENRAFIEFIEAAAGEVDITKADIVISVGRGIKEQSNIALIEDFAGAIGGVVACSRPIVDAGWLPKERQVGSSGKTVKPKLYIALGISGAFQHIVGMKSADTIIAVNKDPNAPIFNEADYGIVDDLFKVVPALKSRILELKQVRG